jgi:hypothetical protein
VRWEGLFEDLEAQAAQLAAAERAAEIDDRTRGEIGKLGVLERLRTAVGQPVRLRLPGGSTAAGVVVRVGPEWLLLDETEGREVVVAMRHLLGARGLVRFSAVPDSLGVVDSRLGIRHVLRGIARDRSPVRIQLVDATSVDATVDRVGADFIEVATHAPGEARRRQDVRDVELLPISALVAIRRAT